MCTYTKQSISGEHRIDFEVMRIFKQMVTLQRKRCCEAHGDYTQVVRGRLGMHTVNGRAARLFCPEKEKKLGVGI